MFVRLLDRLPDRLPIRRTAPLLVALVAAVSLAGCGQGDDTVQGDKDTAARSTGGATDESTAAPSGDVTALTVPSGEQTGRCAVPTAELLAGFDTAFEGTVTDLADATATLSVDTWYAGDETDTVTVTAPSQQMQDLVGAVDFEEGSSYLVVASDGQVSLCGYTGQAEPDLQELYESAFTG